ncbi:MAG: tetratricopeptide repeat protein [Sphingomonas sp.]
MIRIAAFLALLCIGGEARAEWYRAETAHFTLQAELSEAEMRQLAREIEALDAVLVAMTRAPGEGHGRKLDILMLDRVSTLRRLAGLDAFTGAFFFNNSVDQAAVVAREDSGNRVTYDVRDALFHEYGHYFLRRHLGVLQPAWFHEGFASLFESARMAGAERMRVGDIPKIALTLDPAALAPFATIAEVEDAMRLGEERQTLYAQGWLVAHHYFFGGRRAGEIQRYLELVRAGKPIGRPEALFAGGYKGFDADIAGYAAATLPEPRELDVPPLAPGAVTVRPLRPGEVALVERRVDDAEIGGGWLERSGEFARAYQAADARLAEWPDEPALALYAARMAFLSGNHVRAAELIGPLLARDPADPDLLALEGRVLVLAARAGGDRNFAATLAESRALLLRVLAKDPWHVDALAGMHENLTEARGANAEAIAYLKRAIEVQPDNVMLRQRAIEHMLRTGDYRGAIAILQPIANAPHGGAVRKHAAELIAEIRRRTGVK